ncbi:hypothetical protein PYCC9005_002645 [Savitreella phatthalungensis]
MDHRGIAGFAQRPSPRIPGMLEQSPFASTSEHQGHRAAAFAGPNGVGDDNYNVPYHATPGFSPSDQGHVAPGFAVNSAMPLTEAYSVNGPRPDDHSGIIARPSPGAVASAQAHLRQETSFYDASVVPNSGLVSSSAPLQSTGVPHNASHGMMFPPSNRTGFQPMQASTSFPGPPPPSSRIPTGSAPGTPYDLSRPDFRRHHSQHSTTSHVSSQSISSQRSFDFPGDLPTRTFDTTGQSCPPGGRPRVSTTIWEDEGTLCFQIEARQVTVARREDNDMINGTKLLNVAGMSRGKRDGLLKNEPLRTVIKIGSMHLKGVWIPFERALDMANRHNITDLLYPLFVRDIKKFLYHPANYARTAAVLAAATQRQTGSSLGMEDSRPGLERTMSMPTPLERPLSMLTPPSSASATGVPATAEHWQASANVPLSELQARSHSMPGTPATTPPGPFPHASSFQNQPYLQSSLLDARFSGGNLGAGRYGQQPDMQRLYSSNHSRAASVMSYQDEPGQQQTHSTEAQNNHVRGHRAHASVNNIGAMTQPHSQSMGDMAGAQKLHPSAMVGGSGAGPIRAHSRSRSSHNFSTPNLTQQMARRQDRTPNRSPVRQAHARQASRDGLSASTPSWLRSQAELRQKTQDQLGTPHDSLARPDSLMEGQQENASGLPHIYEETPSCRMAYQLHGQQRSSNMSEAPPTFGISSSVGQAAAPSSANPETTNYGMLTTSPHVVPSSENARQHFTGLASPLTGKNKRERGIMSDVPGGFVDSGRPYVHQSPLQPRTQQSQRQLLQASPRFEAHQQGIHPGLESMMPMDSYREASLTPPPLHASPHSMAKMPGSAVRGRSLLPSGIASNGHHSVNHADAYVGHGA